MSVKYKGIFLVFALSIHFVYCQNELPRISVDKNNFVDKNDEKIVFRGINTSDPDKLKTQGQWNKSYFKEIKKWGANIVRFPIHPSAWRKRSEKNYLKLIDKGIKWANKEGLYVIIDWHSIGNLLTNKYTNKAYHTTLEETCNFWKTIAAKYGKNTTVAFYELFNEPTTQHNTLGKLNWDKWKKFNEDIIKMMRNNGAEGIPLVAGYNWAYNLKPVMENPIDAKDIGYVAHPYPQKVTKPWKEKWTKDWGFVKEKYPLMLTEIGFCGADNKYCYNPLFSDASYAESITNYSDKKEISYLVWVFDPEWVPTLFLNWDYAPSKQGKYFKKKLQSYKEK